MTDAELRKILSKVEYRNWEWKLGNMNEGFYIQAQFQARNANTGVFEAQTGRKWYLSSFATPSEVIQTALLAILVATEHEVREEFKYNGVKVFGPHHNLNDLAVAIQLKTVREDKRA